MKIFIIKRKLFFIILWGLYIGVGFLLSHLIILPTHLPFNKKYEEAGFHFVPLSEIIYGHNPNKPHQNRNLIVGLDPGHGGIDCGTKWGEMLEKDLNLKFSRQLAQGLEKRGFRVVLTRDEDQLLTPATFYFNKKCPNKKEEFQRRIQKLETANVSTIVCIHANWNKLAYHRGPVVYYSANSPVSQKIAQHVQEHLNQVQPYRKLPMPNNYYILNNANIPTVLVELGFFSNQEDRRLLQDDQYLERLKSAIINGLVETL